MAIVQPSWAKKFRTRFNSYMITVWDNLFIAAHPALDDTQNINTSGTIMNLMPKGAGTATATHAAPIMFPDADGVYRSADIDVPAWNGARVDLDPAKLFWSGLGVTASTPTSIANMRAFFSDGSTHREKYSDGYIGDSVASGINATYRPDDGETIDVYVGSNVNLIIFWCNNNQLTGSIPDLSSNVNLTSFWCHVNKLTGSIPDLSSNVNLTSLYCNANQLTGYVGGWPAKAFNFNASGNALTEAAVNLILTEADTYGIATGTTINLTGGTNAAPTGAGLTAKANLIANGATVTTNV